MAITTALVPVDTPTLLNANEIYALPSAGNQITWQSVAGSDLQASVDGVIFGTLGASAANEPKTAFTSAAYIRCATPNTFVISKVAPISTLSPPTGGGGGGGGVGGALHPDGTAALPGIAFENEPDLGFYRSALGVSTFANGGVGELSINGNTHVVSVDNLSVQTRIATGLEPATSGVIRLSDDSAIVARSTSGSVDVNLIGLDQTGIHVGGYGQVYIESAVIFNSSAIFGPSAAFVIKDRVPPSGTPTGGEAVLWMEDSGTTTFPDEPLSQIKVRFGTGPDFILAKEGGLPASVSLAATDFIAVGTNPATIGSLRLPNNGSISARNAANTADRDLLVLNASDLVVLGNSASSMQVNSSIFFLDQARFNLFAAVGANPAINGQVRLSNPAFIFARNSTNSGDIFVIGLSSTDEIEISSGESVIIGGAATFNLGAAFNLGATFTGAVGFNDTVFLEDLTFFNGVAQFNASIRFVDSPDPAAPEEGAFVYTRDVGGKTELMARFKTGAPVRLAIEP